MTRAKNNAESHMTRARNNAEGRAARGRNEAKRTPYASRSRMLAAVRMQVCANVFARSRIHFDAGRAASRLAEAIDIAGNSRTAPADPREQPAGVTANAADEFTIH